VRGRAFSEVRYSDALNYATLLMRHALNNGFAILGGKIIVVRSTKDYCTITRILSVVKRDCAAKYIYTRHSNCIIYGNGDSGAVMIAASMLTLSGLGMGMTRRSYPM
jgi:hypothetical protein